MRLDRTVVAAVAEHQGHVITTAELERLGADRSWITRQTASGRWQRLHRGVLLTHSGPVAWESRAFAALMYAGKHASLSHAAAAHLNRMTPRAPEIIDVTIPSDRRVLPSEGLLIHHRERLPGMTGWPLRTGVADTAIDLVATADGTDDALARTGGTGGTACASSSTARSPTPAGARTATRGATTPPCSRPPSAPCATAGTTRPSRRAAPRSRCSWAFASRTRPPPPTPAAPVARSADPRTREARRLCTAFRHQPFRPSGARPEPAARVRPRAQKRGAGSGRAAGVRGRWREAGQPAIEVTVRNQ